MTQPSDKQQIDLQILDLLQTKRKQGFELLFHTYYSEVCQHIYRIYPRTGVVEDIAQDIFLELWRKGGSLTIESSPGAYLRRMAVTRTLNYLRDTKRKRYESDEALKTKETDIISPIEILEHGDLAEWLTQSIDQLPERCRQVFVLSRFEELSYKEIALEMDISPKTVENQMTKALSHLRQAYKRFRAHDIGEHSE